MKPKVKKQRGPDLVVLNGSYGLGCDVWFQAGHKLQSPDHPSHAVDGFALQLQ